MVELTSYGLTGLTAMLVIVFCLAYSDALLATQERSLHALINNEHLNDSRIIRTMTDSLRLGSAVGETADGRIYRDSCRNACRRLEVFHG
jgi:hypothetical protein